MLVLRKAALATVAELFRYRSEGFTLPQFPGYTHDQWGIKAHNRPWLERAGQFAKGQRIIEVGGGYSLLPEYLAANYELEAWIGDDFGVASGEPTWSRWGSPRDLPDRHPSVKYVFERFGSFSPQFPDAYFDRVFTVSSLEHVAKPLRLAVLKDMHRCLRPGGRELHTVDIAVMTPKRAILSAFVDRYATLRRLMRPYCSEIGTWIELIRASGVSIATSIPSAMQMLDRRILVESPDVVYRFYPPNNAPKPYCPTASLLLLIVDE